MTVQAEFPHATLAKRGVKPLPLFERALLVPAIGAAFRKLDPRTLAKNPVMFVVEIVSVLTTIFFLRDLFTEGNAGGRDPSAFLRPDHAVAVVHGACPREFRREAVAGRARQGAGPTRCAGCAPETAAKSSGRCWLARRLSKFRRPRSSSGDVVLVETGDYIPSDGEVIEGVASVDESAITGESAPVIRESGGDRSAVTGGTRVLSDWIKVRITASAGSTFLDRMISLVEGAVRQKTPGTKSPSTFCSRA